LSGQQAAALLAASEESGVDYFLKIETVKGESKDAVHKDEIDVLRWDFDVANKGAFGTVGAGGGTGKSKFGDLKVWAKFSKATPKLMQANATFEHFPKAVLTCRKAGGVQQEYLIITLTTVGVSSYSMGGTGGDQVGIDEIHLNYKQIEMQYKEQKEDGNLGSPIKVGYNTSFNKTV
jgi:type VI secretion system secreted protein Hcp